MVLKKGVCVHYKEYIPLIRRDAHCTLDNCLVAEIRLENEKCFLTCLFRSPHQSQHQFENFYTNLDFLIDNITMNFLLSQSCSKWFNKNITNLVGYEIDSLTSSAGYKQLSNKPTHIINNSFSCINLIFCNNQKLISNYGVDLSIFDGKCHHNIIFRKINIHIPLPLSYV